jgi:hypothetical protein
LLTMSPAHAKAGIFTPPSLKRFLYTRLMCRSPNLCGKCRQKVFNWTPWVEDRSPSKHKNVVRASHAGNHAGRPSVLLRDAR